MRWTGIRPWAFLILIIWIGSGCAKNNAASVSCPTLTGNSWVPAVSGASSSSHNPSVTVARTDLAAISGPITGFAQGFDSSRIISVSIGMSQDLGSKGSLSLVATVDGFPTSLQGGAFPALISLSDGTNDLIDLPIAGTGGDCAQNGFFSSCSSSGCVTNPSCFPVWPSSYPTFTHWEEHQVSGFGYLSVNTFPTCSWTTGSIPSNGAAIPSNYPPCAYQSGAGFQTTKLRTGTYTAKYLLIASNYASLPSSYSANLHVSVIKKTNAGSNQGAVDLNVILVGSKNIQSSRTQSGQRNLDTVLTSVAQTYASANVGLGKINAIEWTCENGGDSYANIDSRDINQMIMAGTSLLPSAEEGKALNVFFISSFTDNSAILGLSAAILGPMLNGTSESGLVFASFNELDTFNAHCTTDPCPLTQQDSGFFTMYGTMAHEMGHYLGLNHPSEASGTSHDPIYDTPICTAVDNTLNPASISIASCLLNDTNSYPPSGKTCNAACTGYNSDTGTYCPSAQECPFNYLMWRTSKHFYPQTGASDGNILSAGNISVIQYNPFIQ